VALVTLDQSEAIAALIAKIEAAGDTSPQPWLAAAAAERAAGRLPDARILLDTALGRFPQTPSVLHDRARLAEAENQWSDAASLWRRFILLEPGIWWSYTNLAHTLRMLGQTAAADTVLTETADRFTDIAGFGMALAEMAEAAGNLHQAAERWAKVVTRFPQEAEAWARQARVLRTQERTGEARALLRDALLHFPNRPALLHELARSAAAERDWPEAEQAWRLSLDGEPTAWWAVSGLAQTLWEQGRPAEAETELGRRLGDFPHEPAIYVEHARLAERRADWPEVIRRFGLCLLRFPDRTDAIIGLSMALGHLGQVAAADAVLQKAIKRTPDQTALQIALTRVPITVGSSGDPEFLNRALALQQRHPDNLDVCRNTVEAMESNYAYAELETHLVATLAQFPADERTSHALANTRVRLGRYAAAIQAFADHITRFGATSAVLKDQAAALTAAKRWPEANAVVQEARKRFPSEWSFDVILLDLLIAEQRPAEAVTLWQSLDTTTAPAGLRQALFERRNLLLGLGTDPAARTAPTANQNTIEHLITRFESLGGHGLGCEFGLLQRHYGAEPLGLLRWTEIEPHALRAALARGLEGVGAPENTVVTTPQHGDHLEYTASDRRFGMAMHTFVRADQVPEDQMFTQICRRLHYLKTKLLDDLRQGDKIFVYKNAYADLTDAEITALHTAFRQLGPSTLLCVRREDKARPFPFVEAPAPGLMIAYIDAFAVSPDGEARSLPVASWTALLTRAYQMWQPTA
jgi:tetratricopeptide (TPR) repeat protein